MAIVITSNLIGLLLFLFIFWKKLKEDYIPIQIFNSASFIVVFLLAATLVSDKFFQASKFWLSFSGIGIGLTIGIARYRLRIFETIEATIIGLFPWLALTFLADAIVNSSTSSLIASGVIVIFIGLYLFLDKHYKRFSWYKSGRVGFAGLTVLGIFFLIRAFVAAVFDNMLSFAMNYEALLSGVAAFVSFLAVFNLARQKT